MSREYYLGYVYGISTGDYQHMLDEQEGKCAICGVSNTELHVDHDHDTGDVRALLCFSCNSGLGMFKDDPELLRKAAVYIIDNRVQSQSRQVLEGKIKESTSSFPKSWRVLEPMLTREELEYLSNLDSSQVKELAQVVGVTEKTVTNWRTSARTKLGE